ITASLPHPGQRTPSGQRGWRTSAKHLASSNSSESLTRSDEGMTARAPCATAAADQPPASSQQKPHATATRSPASQHPGSQQEPGRFAAANRHRRGAGGPETSDFLGFTHFCGVTRKGGFMVQRKTQRTRMACKLKELRAAMKKRRHDPVADQSRWLGAVLRGHYAYFGITGNSASITKFHFAVVQWWRWVLRRRGQRPKLPWARFNVILERFALPRPRIVPNWCYQMQALG